MSYFTRLILGFYFLFIINLSNAKEVLFIEPDAGRGVLIDELQKASSSIQLVMYGLTDQAFINTLVYEKNKGKEIQILIEPKPYKNEQENNHAINFLKKANLSLQFANPLFRLTHQKTFLMDHHDAIVMTFNLTHSAFTKERNFAILIDHPKMVDEIEKTFIADWKRQKIAVSQPHLIWSPDNSRKKILKFIRNADSEIKIYAQDISDYQVIGALAHAARSGRKIQILLSPLPHQKIGKLNYLRRAGVLIQFSKNLWIHAKVIIADKSRAIIGSINLTKASLDDNRELSVITSNKKVIEKLLETFDHDWQYPLD